MKQIIYLGFVVNVNYNGYLNFAQVRVPALHGIPISESELVADSLTQDFKSTCNYDVAESNGNLTIDEELPWYPLCYSFGNTIGPSPGDVVFVALESVDSAVGIVLGWTGNQMVNQSDKKQDVKSLIEYVRQNTDLLSLVTGFNLSAFMGGIGIQ